MNMEFEHLYTVNSSSEKVKRWYNSNKSCSVPQCSNRCRSKLDGISLHSFPKDKNLRKKWAAICHMNTVPKNAFACSIHFASSDFVPSAKRPVVSRRIKPNAVPSQLLPKKSLGKTISSTVRKRNTERDIRAGKRSLRFENKHRNEISNTNDSDSTTGSPERLLDAVMRIPKMYITTEPYEDAVSGLPEQLQNLDKTDTLKIEPSSTRDVATQTDINIMLLDLIQIDRQLLYLRKDRLGIQVG